MTKEDVFSTLRKDASVTIKKVLSILLISAIVIAAISFKAFSAAVTVETIAYVNAESESASSALNEADNHYLTIIFF